MTSQTEALKLALALVVKGKRYADECSHMATQADIDEFDAVATAIKEALARPEQLEGLQLIHKADIDLAKKRAIKAQPAVAEQHKQEPVAWMTTEVTTGTQVWLYKKTAERYQNPPIPLYTHPPVPTAQPKEPEQEPVAWRWIPSDVWGSYVLSDSSERAKLADEHGLNPQPLYTTPPQRKPLTDEEIRKAKHHMVDGAYQYSFMQGVRYAEAAHGIKE